MSQTAASASLHWPRKGNKWHDLADLHLFLALNIVLETCFVMAGMRDLLRVIAQPLDGGRKAAADDEEDGDSEAEPDGSQDDDNAVFEAGGESSGASDDEENDESADDESEDPDADEQVDHKVTSRYKSGCLG